MLILLNISNIMNIIGELITIEFLSAITGGVVCSSEERRLLALPAKLCGLGILLFSDIPDIGHENWKLPTKTLHEKIVSQDTI